MKINYSFTIFILFIFFVSPAQTNLDGYKYIIVPKNYDFLKQVDQYQLNSLTKFLFNKYNFNVYLDDENLPEDLFKDRCLALYANVLREKSLFKTRLTVELQDCKKNIVFVTREGASKEKNFEKAYHEALRKAFQSFKSVNYSYNPQLKQKEESDNEELKQFPEKIVIPEVKPVISKNSKTEKPKTNQKAKPQKPNLPVKPKEISKSKPPKTEIKKPKIIDSKPLNLLYAQAIDNGFQLVDSTPKVVYTIFYSGKKDIFMVKGKDAIIYKLNETWVIAEQIDDKLEVTSLKIKF